MLNYHSAADVIVMPLKKVDARVRTLIENSVTLKHRCMFVVVGDKGRDQVSVSQSRHCAIQSNSTHAWYCAILKKPFYSTVPLIL